MNYNLITIFYITVVIMIGLVFMDCLVTGGKYTIDLVMVVSEKLSETI